MRILITGTNGYIGKHLSQVSPYDVTCLHRGICDLTDKEEVDNFFGQFGKFDVVIHCAAIGGSRLVTDEDDVFHDNIQMFLNLVRNKDSFDRLIHFGSGAEKIDKGPYGFSKRVIANMVEELDNFYNLVIYCLFDENELPTRFIKSCITACLEGNAIEVHGTKKMDFFHMRDLESIVNYYTSELEPPKTIDCCYSEKYHLHEIADHIRKYLKTDTEIHYKLTEPTEYIGEGSLGLHNLIDDDFITRLNRTIDIVRKKYD